MAARGPQMLFVLHLEISLLSLPLPLPWSRLAFDLEYHSSIAVCLPTSSPHATPTARKIFVKADHVTLLLKNTTFKIIPMAFVGGGGGNGALLWSFKKKNNFLLLSITNMTSVYKVIFFNLWAVSSVGMFFPPLIPPSYCSVSFRPRLWCHWASSQETLPTTAIPLPIWDLCVTFVNASIVLHCDYVYLSFSLRDYKIVENVCFIPRTLSSDWHLVILREACVIT